MAKISISHTEPEFTGLSEFEQLWVSFVTLDARVKVAFRGSSKLGVTSLINTYDEMSIEGKPFSIEFIKRLVVNAYNNAMGTTYTWDQVPDSIFGE